MELIADYTVRGNRNPQTKAELPHLLEITRFIPCVKTAHTVEHVSRHFVCGKREAKRLAKSAGATCWNF